MAADATHAPRSSTMMSCVIWIRNRVQKVTRGGFSSSFGPSSARRFAANSGVRPLSRSECRLPASLATGMLCTSSFLPRSSSAASCILASSTRFSADSSEKMRVPRDSKRWRWISFSISGSTSLGLKASARASRGPGRTRAASTYSSNSSRLMSSSPPNELPRLRGRREPEPVLASSRAPASTSWPLGAMIAFASDGARKS
mmetsp:Transcript_17855/g.53120  ORF Transcript_17855/g.53120 Transcript_17855/m.53120 type:complete len:201 (+) Transcript_17855:561-1163(+)